MPDLPGFSKGGIVHSPDITIRLVPEISPDGNGSLSAIFADECIINRNQVCTRRDQYHANAPQAAVAANPNRQYCRWYCPLHDEARAP